MKKGILKVSVVFLIILSVFTLMGSVLSADKNVDQPLMEKIEKHAVSVSASFNPQKVNESLKQFAIHLAKLVNEDPRMKELIGMEVGKKFDGDFDSLFEMIADVQYKGKSLRSSLRNIAKGMNVDLDSLISAVPYLNIAIPVNYAQWNSYPGPIYVIPLKYGVNEEASQDYIGYDGKGKTRAFSAQACPDYPVIVVGINERIEFLKQNKAELLLPGNVSLMSAADGQTSHNEALVGVYLNDALEPWTYGSPEVYVLVVDGNNQVRNIISCPEVTNTFTWCTFNKPLFTYWNRPELMNYYLELRESDSGTATEYPINKSYFYDGLTRTVAYMFTNTQGITVEDDDYGYKLITFYHTKPFEVLLDGAQKAYVRVSY